MLSESLQLLFLILIVLRVSSTVDDVCLARFEKQISLTPEECPPAPSNFKNYILYDGKSSNEKLPKCFPYCKQIELGLDKLGNPCTNKDCPPAYSCKGEPPTRSKCEADETSCFMYHLNYGTKDGMYYKAMWKPECMTDESWAPKQCKGDKFTGRCFCYNAQGKRIDGQQWVTKSENMTCACSRRRYEMVQNNPYSYSSLHCDQEGNYEPLQCNDGQCWCAHPPSGKVVSKVVPESMMKILPCYDVKLNGDRYLRQCESKLRAQQKIMKKLNTHGTTGFLYNSILCDADGTYGKFKIVGNAALCVWKDDQPLGSGMDLSDIKNDVANMNCNCARDRKYYELAGQNPDDAGSCDGNGNYAEIQWKLRDDGTMLYFCVDSDGFQKSPLFEDKKKLNCNAYK